MIKKVLITLLIIINYVCNGMERADEVNAWIAKRGEGYTQERPAPVLQNFPAIRIIAANNPERQPKGASPVSEQEKADTISGFEKQIKECRTEIEKYLSESQTKDAEILSLKEQLAVAAKEMAEKDVLIRAYNDAIPFLTRDSKEKDTQINTLKEALKEKNAQLKALQEKEAQNTLSNINQTLEPKVSGVSSIKIEHDEQDDLLEGFNIVPHK